jgi:transcription elongation factor GreA
MQPEPILFTVQGYAALPAELSRLQKYREEVVVRLQKAREQGDLSENGAYKAARFELSDTDRSIRRVQHQIKYGRAVTPPTDGTVGIGSVVTLAKPDGTSVTYTIVGTYEADPLQGKISPESPMGQALVGKRGGIAIQVNGNQFTLQHVR